MPKHWTNIPESLGLVIEQPVLITCPNTTGGSLRSEREAVAVIVGKGVHLFFDNIGLFADRSPKQFCSLNDRCANLTITITARDFSQRGLNPLPGLYLAGQ